MHQYHKEPVHTHLTTKVPKVTLGFWIIKILATTLGETGGDAVTMSMNFGYLAGTAIFAAIFAAAVATQISTRRFHPFLYWTVIVATTTVGTTLADFVDRSLEIGYLGGSSLLAALLIASLLTWFRTLGTVSTDSINSKQAETFIGSGFCIRRPWAPRSATGWPIRRGSDMPGRRNRHARLGICDADPLRHIFHDAAFSQL
jgi:uncharacterized membrane-anchored protein